MQEMNGKRTSRCTSRSLRKHMLKTTTGKTSKLEKKWEQARGRQRPWIEEISPQEVEQALLTCKKGKAGASDGMLYEILFYAGPSAWTELAQMLTSRVRNMPPYADDEAWSLMQASLVNKVAKPTNFTQWRALHGFPTCSQIYDKVVLARLSPGLDYTLGYDVIGFRPGHQAPEMSLYVKSRIEHAREWGFPIYVCKADGYQGPPERTN